MSLYEGVRKALSDRHDRWAAREAEASLTEQTDERLREQIQRTGDPGAGERND